MNDFSILKKIAFGFGVILALTLVVGSIALNSLRDIEAIEIKYWDALLENADNSRDIELLKDGFKGIAIELSIINSVVENGIDLLGVLESFKGIQSQEADTVVVPFRVDLINAELSHRSFVLSLVLLRWIPSWKQRKSL